MNDKIREEFEAGWGFTNEEQECYFIPELNMYGSEKVNRAAESKSTAWYYFSKGWKAAHETVVIDLPKGDSLARRMYGPQACGANPLISRFDAVEAIEAAGLRVTP